MCLECRQLEWRSLTVVVAGMAGVGMVEAGTEVTVGVIMEGITEDTMADTMVDTVAIEDMVMVAMGMGRDMDGIMGIRTTDTVGITITHSRAIRIPW